MSNSYQYSHCQPAYRQCFGFQQNEVVGIEGGIKSFVRSAEGLTEKMVDTVRNSAKPTLYHPNPMAPHGGAKEWMSNDLLLQDVDLRRLARVRPLDCGIRELYVVNPVPKL